MATVVITICALTLLASSLVELRRIVDERRARPWSLEISRKAPSTSGRVG